MNVSPRPAGLEVDPLSLDLGEWRDALVVDLREVGEPGRLLPAGLDILHLPMSGMDIPDPALPIDRDLLVVCAHGRRSLYIVNLLRAAGLPRCWSLRGGMEGLAGLA